MRFLCGWTKGIFQEQLESFKDRGSPACCAWFLKSEGHLGHQDKGLHSGTIPEHLIIYLMQGPQVMCANKTDRCYQDLQSKVCLPYFLSY